MEQVSRLLKIWYHPSAIVPLATQLCGKSSGWRPVSSPSLVERMTHIHTHAQVEKITGGGVSVTSA